MINANLKRDYQTGAVLNTDVAALNKYKQERAFYRKVEKLCNEVKDVKACLQNVNDRLDRIEKQINVET